MEKPKPEESHFTLEQIKQAFWDTFYGVGEVWFPYEGQFWDDDECESAVDNRFQDFMENLKNGKSNR